MTNVLTYNISKIIKTIRFLKLVLKEKFFVEETSSEDL